MNEAIGGVLSVLFGPWFALFHRTLGEKAVKYHQKFWWGESFGQGTIRVFQIGFLLAGLFFILFGLLSLFRIL